MKKQLILNSSGKVVTLGAEDNRRALRLEKMIKNDLGYNIPITTLTQVLAKVSEQKFFEVAVADYIPVKVGDGAWADRILQFRSQGVADDFSTGIINTSVSNGRLASADAGIEAVSNPIYNWAKEIGWTLFDLRLAARSGNWDIVEAKEKARKKNWDLGIQSVGFLGLAGDTNKIPGLLNQSGVTNNTTLITEPLSGMTAAELTTFLAGVLNAYRVNNNRTAWPDRFVIPESDYLGLAVPSSSDFPIKSKLEILETTFKVLTKNPNFKILPLAYADNAYGGLGQRYALYNSSEDSIYMNIPVDYTSTAQSTFNNFHFQNVAYGQFGGVFANRPQELLYFTY